MIPACKRAPDLLVLTLTLVLTLALASASASAQPLVCIDADGARLAFRAACAGDRACRFEVIDNARVGSDAWYTVLAARIDDVLFNTSARALLEPPEWLDAGPYVSVDALLGANCSAPAPAPALAIRAAVGTFVAYQSYVAEDGRCSDLNTAAVLGSDGELTCQCLPDKVCEPTGQRRVDMLLQFIVVLTIVAAVGAFVAVIVIPLRNVVLDP